MAGKDENASFLQRGKLLALHNLQELKTQLENEQRNNENLREELRRIKSELQRTCQKLSDLQTKYDNLLIVKMSSATESDRRNAKRRLTKMVQEIDNCLALLHQ